MWNPFKSKRTYRTRSIKRERVSNSKLNSSLECKADGTSKYCGKDKALRPIIARAGGKSQLAPKIIKEMKKHRVYNEPFVGGGAVFLKKPKAKKNYINDKDSDVIAVFKAHKNKVGFEKCDMTPSKRRFDRIKNKSKKSVCDVAYLNKLSFGSNGKHYAESKVTRVAKDLGISYQNAHKDDYKEKLENTTITNQDFKKAVQKTKNIKDSVTFMDPPYFGADKMYKERGVTPKEVCDTAKKMKGQVLITYNNVPEVRKNCSRGFRVKRISSRYALNNRDGVKNSKELLIIKN